MVFYIASPTYQHIILKTIQENALILEGYEHSREIYLSKYVKENISRLDSLEQFVIDLTSLNDTDEEILEAIETLKIMANHMRIIIIAANRLEGDELLTKLFQMSIYDIINTDDFNEIGEELQYCLLYGKQFRDAIRFKESNNAQEKVVTRTEVKQTVNKVMLAIAGAQDHIGTTHNSIVLANYLRKRGYMVALVEYNSTNCFEQIRDAFDERMFGNYFSMNGVDYYPSVNSDQLGAILGKAYNFIVVDFGNFSNCDQVNFNMANERFIVLGSKPWELNYANEIFTQSQDAAKHYHYLFNFTTKANQKDILQGMEGIESVNFLEYSENPFAEYGFANAEKILKEYLPIKVDSSKKKGLFKGKEK